MTATKKASRVRRGSKIRHVLKEARTVSICINKTPRHMYAYLINADRSKTLACASTVEKDVRGKVKYTGNVEAAKAVGKLIAERAVKLGFDTIAFDRSGFKYHGRVKALADAAREAGLKF
jgi:large subunit ribosomal protein L18